MATRRATVVRELWEALVRIRPQDRILVAIDGFDGVGKTHLATELVAARRADERPVLSLSIDGFHRPRAERRASGHGPEGFYRGSYRYDAFRAAVVDPLRAGRPVTPAVWDVDADVPVSVGPLTPPPRAVVLVDGIFLQRPELADVWDGTVWVDAPFSVTVPRGNARYPGEHDPDPEAEVYRRYVGGQRLYLAEADPRGRADWVFDNEDLAHPCLRRR